MGDFLIPDWPMDDALVRLGRALIAAFAVFWLVFLLVPIVVTMIASLTSSSYLVFPPPGLSLQWYVKGLGVSWFWPTFANSLIIAAVSTAIASAIGVAAARVLARHRFFGRGAFEYVVLSPLIIPGVVVGFALFNFAVMIDFQDAPLLNLIIGHTIVTIPFCVRSIWSAMAGTDISIEEAAQSLLRRRVRFRTFRLGIGRRRSARDGRTRPSSPVATPPSSTRPPRRRRSPHRRTPEAVRTAA